MFNPPVQFFSHAAPLKFHLAPCARSACSHCIAQRFRRIHAAALFCAYQAVSVRLATNPRMRNCLPLTSAKRQCT